MDFPQNQSFFHQTGIQMIVRMEPVLDPRLDRVAEAARRQLELSPYSGIRQVRCESNGRGVLYLRGELPSFYYKQLAQQAVLKLEGVTQVVNEVVVT